MEIHYIDKDMAYGESMSIKEGNILLESVYNGDAIGIQNNNGEEINLTKNDMMNLYHVVTAFNNRYLKGEF